MKKADLKIVMMVISFVVIIIFLMSYGDRIGLEADVELDFLQLFPGLFAILVGFGIVARTRGTFAFPGLFAVGLGFAYTFEVMYDMGLITTIMLSGLTIGELQLWVIVIATIMGGIVTALTWR